MCSFINMFSSPQEILKKTGPDGVGRFSYLQTLVTEYSNTSSQDCKRQVLANLVNFAYDPVNYFYMKELNCVDLFLDTLDDEDGELVDFALTGLCNICLDPLNGEVLLKRGGVEMITGCLNREDLHGILVAITTLRYLKPKMTVSHVRTSQ